MNRKFVIVATIVVVLALLAACGGEGLTGGTNVPVVTELVTNENVCSVANDPPCFVPEGWLRERYYDN